MWERSIYEKEYFINSNFIVIIYYLNTYYHPDQITIRDWTEIRCTINNYDQDKGVDIIDNINRIWSLF